MLTSRPDATRCTDISAARGIMPFLMPGRTESAVGFEQQLDLTKTQPFIDGWNERHPEQRISVFHVFLFAMGRTLREWPRLNRFVSGKRIWQRHGVHLSFAAKKKMANGSPLVIIKRRVDQLERFEELVALVSGDVKERRTDKKSGDDKKLAKLLALPAPLLSLAMKLVRWADGLNLLPASFIDGDPLYTSMFVANLGSVGIEAAYHHLFEYGNCPFFAAIGKTKAVVTPEGVKSMCTIKYTFDERIEDGMYCASALEHLKGLVENPTWLAPATGAPRRLAAV